MSHWRGKWVISKKGNIDLDKFKFKNGNIKLNIDFFNIDSKTGSNGVPRGVGGWLLMMIGDGMTPFDPVLLSMLKKSMLNSM